MMMMIVMMIVVVVNMLSRRDPAAEDRLSTNAIAGKRKVIAEELLDHTMINSIVL